MTILAITASIANAILDILFVFGYCGFPQLGTAGAAYATLVSQIFVFAIALSVFLSKKNAEKYDTRTIKFDFNALKSCLAIGIPFSISSSINCFAFAFLVRTLASFVSFCEFATFGITHSFYGASTFFLDISKGVGVACSNYIGAGQPHYIKNTLFSATKIHILIMAGTFVIMVIFAAKTVHLCFPLTSHDAQSAAIELMPKVWGCLLVDGLLLYLQSMLISAGDTKFIMYTNLYVFILTVVIPGYVGIAYFGLASNFLWWIFMLDSCQRVIIFYIRYKSGHWLGKKIIR
jgi:Na+-driven multidrug efflux pump